MNRLRPKTFYERHSTGIIILAALGLMYAYAYLETPPEKKKTAPGSDSSYITFGSGKVNGSYFPVVTAIAQHLNRLEGKLNGHRVRIHCEPGSVSTVREVVSGRLEFGVAQSAVLYDAANGLRDWAPYGRMLNLRSVCTLATKDLTIVARADSGILSTADLKGKRVNIGDPGTGTNSNARQLLDFIIQNGGFGPESLLELSNEEALSAFRDSKLDAIVTNLTHPSRYLQDVFRCGVPARLVRIHVIDDFIRQYPYYAVGNLPASTYPEAVDRKDLPVISTPTILFTTEGEPADTVAKIVNELVVNLEAIKRENPELQSMEPESLVADKIVAAHAGAIDAFYDTGILRARAETKRNSLMAISFRRNDPFAERISAGLCLEVNRKRIEDLRLVLLASDNEQENIYRVVSGISHFGFANAAELHHAANGTGTWQPMGPLKCLASLARAYDVVFLKLTPQAVADASRLPYVVTASTDPSQLAAVQAVWATLYPSAPPVLAVSQSEALEAFAAGKSGIILPVAVHGDAPDDDITQWQKQWDQMARQSDLPPARMEAIPLPPAVLGQFPWLDEIEIPLGGQRKKTFSLPVFLFASSLASEERFTSGLRSLLEGALRENAAPGGDLFRRLAYMSTKSPLPFHPAIDTVLASLGPGHPALQAIRPGTLPQLAMKELTISAPIGDCGQFLAAGMVSTILSQPRAILGSCTTSGSEDEALQDIVNGAADMAIVSATTMYRWEQAHPKQQDLRVFGNIYTVPLTFYADVSSLDKGLRSLTDFTGKRVSLPDTTFPSRKRSKGITVFTPDTLLVGLENMTLINTEETGLGEALDMYNRHVITGFFFTGLHPLSRVMNGLSTQRPGRFIPITEGHRIIMEKPYYANAVIPETLTTYYPIDRSIKESVSTIGVPMLLVGSARIPDGMAEELMKTLSDNIGDIRESHPAFADFEASELLKGIAVAPLHPGALRFYQRQGFIGMPGSHDSMQVLNLGTGSQKGSFFPVGVFLERMVNARAQDRNGGFRLTLELSDGSHQNCLAVQDRAYDLGISQADLAALAYEGKTHWASKPLSSLRALCNLQTIPLFCFMRTDRNVGRLDQLQGLSVNIGSEGSGTWLLTQRVLSTLPETVRSLIRVETNDDSVALDKLYSGGLDGLFISISSSETLDRLFNPESPFRPIPLDTPAIQQLADGIHNSMVTLRRQNVPGLPQDLTTLATRAILIAHEEANRETIRDIVRILIHDRAAFSPTPAALRGLKDEDLCRNIPIPLHDGAREAFIEAGLLAPAESAKPVNPAATTTTTKPSADAPGVTGAP